MSSSRAERQLILISAGTAARRERMLEYARRLIVEIDWPRLGEQLRMRRLLSTLGPRIVALADGRASDDFVVVVEQALANGRRQGAFMQLVSARVTSALASAGIRSAVLKGAPFAETIYGDVGRRLSSDIDVLVPVEDLHTAVRTVRELGYDAPTDYVDQSGLPLLHFALAHPEGKLPPVEIHWRVHWYERNFACERLLPPTENATDAWTAAPADELAALLLFYARDGFIDLRLATDLAAWWDARGTELPPGALDRVMSAYPALSRVIPVAVTVAEQIVGVPSGPALEDMPRLGLRGGVAVRLANPNPRASQAQLYADMGLIDGLLMPQGDLGAFIRRQLLLPHEVLAQLDLHAPKRRARSSVARCAGVLGRYGLRLARLVHAPEAPSQNGDA